MHLNLGPDQLSPEVLPQDVWVSVVHSLQPTSQGGSFFAIHGRKDPRTIIPSAHHSFLTKITGRNRRRLQKALMCTLYPKIKKTYSLLLLHLIRFLSATDQLFFGPW